MKIWYCKIGEVEDVPEGADSLMRDAIEEAYFNLTGELSKFIFSGWAGELTVSERSVVDNDGKS